MESMPAHDRPPPLTALALIDSVPRAKLDEFIRTSIGTGKIDEHAAARLIGVSVGTLRNWRRKRVHIAFYKVGAKVFYQVGDCIAFRDSVRIEPRPANEL